MTLGERAKATILSTRNTLPDLLQKALPPPPLEEQEKKKQIDEYNAQFADYNELYTLLRKDITHLYKSYHHYFRNFGIEDEIQLFDDFKLLSSIYQKRTLNSFIFIAQKIKSKVSFFGIYILNERADLQEFRLKILKKKVQKAVQYLLSIQNNTAKNFTLSTQQGLEKIHAKMEESE